MAGRPAIYVVLLRGINVGGHRLAMSDLRAICVDASCDNVSTYIQSGNAIVTSTAKADALAADLERRLSAHAGFDVPVIIRSAEQLAAVVDHNPFADVTDATKLVVTFLPARPKPNALKPIDLEKFAPENVVLRGGELYFHLPAGQARAKLPTATAKAIGLTGTTRNWKTVTKLLDLANSLAG